MRPLFFGLIAAAALITILPNLAYAGGPRGDWFGEYADIPGAVECWYNGYDDGQSKRFDQDRHRECIFDDEAVKKFENEDRDKPYYKAWIIGCRYAGNTEETCEDFVDY
jgi:hypothetical protein